MPLVQVDVRGEQIGKRIPVDVALVGTVKDTAPALLPLLKPRSDREFADKMTGHYRQVRSRLDGLAEGRPSDVPMPPQHVGAAIDRLVAPDAAFTADVGTCRSRSSCSIIRRCRSWSWR